MSSALGLVYYTTLRLTTKRIAVITLALLVSNASIIAFGRTDFGPVILEMILKSASFLYLVLFMRKKQLHYLLFMGAFLLLGEFNKINFLWFTDAIYACLFFEIVRFWRSKKKLLFDTKTFATLGAIFFASFLYYIVIVKYYHIGEGFHLKNPGYVIRSLATTLGGQWYFNVLLQSRVTYFISYTLFALQLIPIVYGIRNGLLKPTKSGDVPLFKWCLIIIGILLAQIAITPNATAAWHYLAVQPFWALTVALSVSFWYQRIPKSKQVYAYAAVVVLCIAQVSIYVLQIPLLRNTKSIAWSKSIYRLADTTKQLDGRVLAADWGLQTQLIALDPTHNKYQEVFGPFDTRKSSEVERIKSTYFATGQTTYIIVHPAKEATFPKDQADILSVANQVGNVKKIKTVYDDSRPTYEIYRLTY